MLPFNKVCEIEDFADPALTAILRTAFAHRPHELPVGFPSGHEDRRDWEWAMVLRSLHHFGAVTSGATLLGVAAARSDLAFYLTQQVRQVFAVDRYVAMAETALVAALRMMTRPEDFAPFPIDRTKLVVQDMDPWSLRYPDATFDGVFVGRHSGLRQLEDAAHASFEVGRVLKPGGVASVILDLRLAGPPGATGSPGGLVLSSDHIERFVVAASGLEPVDEVRLVPSTTTLETRREVAFASQHRSGGASVAVPPGYPRLVVVRDGYVSTSAHVCLRKTERYPCVPNRWAAPPMSTTYGISGPDGAAAGCR